MRKICVFTQTYSNDRSELFYYHNKDLSDLYFRNNFDLNLYSFHNCDKNYVDTLLKNVYFSNILNLKIINYDNITYTESFKKTLNFLYNEGFDYLIFLQDDCLTTSDITEDLINFIKNENFDMLNLEVVSSVLNTNPDIIYSINNFNIYNTNSDDFVRRGWFALDDGAYVAKIDFLLKNVYDENYFNIGDIWNAETYLKNKIQRNPIQRLTTNIPFYARYNILGRHNWDRENSINKLKNRFN